MALYGLNRFELSKIQLYNAGNNFLIYDKVKQSERWCWGQTTADYLG